jgi:hypothetical protein
MPSNAPFHSKDVPSTAAFQFEDKLFDVQFMLHAKP